jgi:glycosyltransferase involved in cell wall biosynthesis
MKKEDKRILLSICVPTYNRPDLLKRTLQSIPDNDLLEVVVTDNSTDDRSEELVGQHYSGHKCSWQYNRNNFPKSWSGGKLMVENFNMGIKLAKGRYILFIHDDDFMWEKGLDYIFEYVQNENNPVLFFGVNLVDADGRKIKSQTASSDVYLNPEQSLKLLLSNSSLVRFPAVVAHRDVYQKVGFFNVAYNGPCDFDLWARIFSIYGVLRVAKVITAYTIHDAAATMKVFNESNIKILMDIFDRVKSWEVLSERQFFNAKSKFFHQYILAGAYRLLRKGEIWEARKIMHLFSIPRVKELNIPVYWLPLRLFFSILLLIPIFPGRLKISLK